MHKFNNCVKVQFEIGHEASLRSEVTPQGFTHDWHVFVRGAENTEIHHFVEKVVFHLHESFPKPKRVVKEPPYEVRESGYASFTFPIEVYLKTKDEPRKLDFLYDLSLNTSGPIRTSQREKRMFNNPSEEFRRKLIKGGGVGVGSDMLPLADNNSQNTDEKNSSKKSSSDSSKKHKSKDSLKPDEVRTSTQFADLFGAPIKTAKLSPSTGHKKTESKHTSDTKVSSKSIKHSPHKEKEKEKESSKKDTMITSSSKEKDKDRDRSKEKEKKAEKSLKRPPSPVAAPPPAKTIKEEKKSSHEEVKEKEKLKSSSSDIIKSEKKEKKKDKKSRDDKDKKDRHKDHESKKDLPPAPPPPLPPPPPVEKEKEKIVEKPEKSKSDPKDLKENVKRSPKNIIKEEKLKEKIDKDKVESVDKQRHKHKKKEKSKKEDKEIKERDKPVKKVEKLPPAPVVVPKEPSPPPHPPPSKSRVRSPSPKTSKNPLSVLMSEVLSDKGSDTESSADEDAKSVEKVKMTPPSLPPPAPAPPVARSPERVKEEKFTKEKIKKKEKKSSSKDEDGSKKKKRKGKEKEEVPEKILKVKSDEEHKIVREEPMDDDVDDRLSEPSLIGSPHREDQELSRSRSPTPPTKFTEEYVMELKDLQQKIMTLEDNAELQRVVQVIAETGQYEITKKTFDFDLCALDKSTVKRLQDLFFAAS